MTDSGPFETSFKNIFYYFFRYQWENGTFWDITLMELYEVKNDKYYIRPCIKQLWIHSILHESSLLNYETYRQDKIKFIEKHNGINEFYPLTDFKPITDIQLQKEFTGKMRGNSILR